MIGNNIYRQFLNPVQPISGVGGGGVDFLQPPQPLGAPPPAPPAVAGPIVGGGYLPNMGIPGAPEGGASASSVAEAKAASGAKNEGGGDIAKIMQMIKMIFAGG